MQVNVLVRNGMAGEVTSLLVLPFGCDASIPEHIRNMGWRGLATATTDDRLLWPGQSKIEADIAHCGFSLLAARGLAVGG